MYASEVQKEVEYFLEITVSQRNHCESSLFWKIHVCTRLPFLLPHHTSSLHPEVVSRSFGFLFRCRIVVGQELPAPWGSGLKTFLVPGIGFMEVSFSTDQWGEGLVSG